MGSLNTYDSANNRLIPIINEMVGAQGSISGIGGLVPAPQAGDENKCLRGDGTWGSTDAGQVIAYNDWIQLTPEQQNTGDWFIPDYNGSILPVGGFDNVPTAGSLRPVTSNGIYTAVNAVNAKVGELSNLDTTDKSSLVAAINELKDAVTTLNTTIIRNMPLTKTTTSFSSLPFTYYDNDIESDMTITWWYASNSAAQTSEWTVTPAAGGGSVTISGSGISGSTTVTFTLQRTR